MLWSVSVTRYLFISHLAPSIGQYGLLQYLTSRHKTIDLIFKNYSHLPYAQESLSHILVCSLLLFLVDAMLFVTISNPLYGTGGEISPWDAAVSEEGIASPDSVCSHVPHNQEVLPSMLNDQDVILKIRRGLHFPTVRGMNQESEQFLLSIVLVFYS